MATAAEKRAEFNTVMQSMVQRFDGMGSDAMRIVTPALARAKQELEADLAAWFASQRPADAFSVQHMRVALANIDRALTRVRELEPALLEGLNLASGDAAARAAALVEEQVIRFSNIFDGSIRPVDIERAVVMARGEKLLLHRYETSARRYAGETLIKIKQEFALAALRGDTMQQTAFRLEKSLPRVFEVQRNAAMRLVRTETMNAYNVHHHEALKEMRSDAGNRDIQMRWDASMDSRLCVVCRNLHGKVAKVNGGKFGREAEEGTLLYPRPPAHPNCRCIIVAWSDRWEKVVNPKDRIEAQPKKGKVKRTKVKKKPKPVPAPKPEAKPKERTFANLTVTERAANPAPPDAKKMAKAFSDYDQKLTTKRAKSRPQTSEELEAGYAIRRPLRDAMKAEGFQRRRAHFTTSDVGYRVYNLPAAAGTNATATQQVTLRPDMHSGASGFFRGVRDGRSVSATETQGAAVMVHEEFHSFGIADFKPPRSSSYKGVGALVEEVTTELSARRYMRRHYGKVRISGVGTVEEAFVLKPQGDARAVAWGYQKEIDRMTLAVKDALDFDSLEAAGDLLERASDEYKRSRFLREPGKLSAKAHTKSFLSLLEEMSGKSIPTSKRAVFTRRAQGR